MANTAQTAKTAKTAKKTKTANVGETEKNFLGEDLADFPRTFIPEKRWGGTWDVFKSCFGRIVLINLLMLLFFVPSIAIVYICGVYKDSLIAVSPGNSVGFGAIVWAPNMTGLAESIRVSADAMFFALFVLSTFVASVGIAGGVYSMRRLLNTHGDFTFKGFFHGVRRCYLNTAVPVFVFSVFLYGSIMVADWRALTIANGGSRGGPITAEVFMIIATVVVGVICMWVLAYGVSYRTSFGKLLKNSFVLMGRSILQTIFMAIFVTIPVWLYWWWYNISFLGIVIVLVFVVFGFSYMVISWMSFTQWVFDAFDPPEAKIKEAENAPKTPEQLAEEAEEERKRTTMALLAAGRSELLGRPIMPIDGGSRMTPLGTVFSRSDVDRVSGERDEMERVVREYEAMHRDDPKYVEYNSMFKEREKVFKDTSKKGKKKKISAKNLLG